MTAKKPTLRLVGGSDVQLSVVTCAKTTQKMRQNDAPNAPSTAHLDEATAGSSSTTAENGRLRESRKENWRMAEAAVRYWRVRLDFSDAVEQAQRMGLPEGSYHPVADLDDRRQSFEDRLSMVGRWRDGGVKHWPSNFSPPPRILGRSHGSRQC